MTLENNGPTAASALPLDTLSLGGSRIAAIGECMMELSDAGDADLRRSFGGDTLNTALYLARSGARVDYVTALGDDPYSHEMIAAWRDEGVGTDHVYRDDGRVPGLYLIRTDPAGERRFFYWRNEAPARTLFDPDRAGQTAAALAGADIIYLSGISLSLYGPDGRQRLFSALATARESGARIVFDANFRPRNWPSRDEAIAAFRAMEALVDVALTGIDDEALLTGTPVSAEALANRLLLVGVREVAIKKGKDGALVCNAQGYAAVPPVTVDPVVDTTAAGDSFNAGYIAGRLSGQSPVDAAASGARLAAIVIGHRGAIIPRPAMAPFLSSLQERGRS